VLGEVKAEEIYRAVLLGAEDEVVLVLEEEENDDQRDANGANGANLVLELPNLSRVQHLKYAWVLKLEKKDGTDEIDSSVDIRVS